MTPTLSPQFNTHGLNLEIKKGESAQFAVAVTNYDLDLRGACVFTEIRRISPGYNLIREFTGSVNQGNVVINIKLYPATEDKSKILNILPVRVGDLITLEGSGIKGAKVLAVTDQQIITETAATRTINEGRLLVRSLSMTSFTAIPYSPIQTITLTGAATTGDTIIPVSNITKEIKAGTILIFNDAGTPKLATLSQDLSPNSTAASVEALAANINSSRAIAGGQSIILTSEAAATTTTLETTALSVPIPSGTILNFATRTADGWVYAGSATLTATALAGASSLSVSALDSLIPQNAIAWFSTVAFNSFYLAIDPADTQFLETGDYGYDVIVRQSDGFTLRIMQGDCKLLDHWSDGI